MEKLLNLSLVVSSGWQVAMIPALQMLFPCAGFSAEEKAIMTAVPLTLIGAGICALFVTNKVKILIDVNITKFDSKCHKLKQYAFLKN